MGRLCRWAGECTAVGLIRSVFLSVAKVFELEPSLLTTVPTTLNQTFEKRSPLFVSLVLQQFETVMFERSAKLDGEIRTSASLRTDAMVSASDARTSLLCKAPLGPLKVLSS